MKRNLLFLLFLLFGGFIYSQHHQTANGLKSKFDIKQQADLTQRKSATGMESKAMIQNQMWEATMLEHGYFSLGTSKGLINSEHDDKCEFTYGHPYSMTSFAYLVIDGKKTYPFQLLSNETNPLSSTSNSLKASSSINEVAITTKLKFNDDGIVELNYNVVNNDDVSHNVNLGLIFDAALGKWGDGFVYHEQEMVSSTVNLDGISIDSLIIWERNTDPKGLGLTMNFEENKPENIVLGNWFSEYEGKEGISEIYDLAIHAKWGERVLSPNDTASFKISFSMLKPEFGSSPFLRWDLPNMFTIENQMLFPANLNTNVEVIKSTEEIFGLKLRVEESNFNMAWESEDAFSLSVDKEINYLQALVNVSEFYDSIVGCVTLQLIKNESVIDEIKRPVFIPAAPFSNEGLIIDVDTAYVADGKVNISFNCSNEETGQLIYELHKNNVFMFDNDVRVSDITLGKDTTGGVNNSDIIFVLDVTGSMGNEIANVRDNIIEFTDSLTARGIDYRLGMVTFLDEIENIYDFTRDAQEFKINVAAQYAHGGGDGPENSLDALEVASNFDFREDANRTIIWITDADYHIADAVTQQTPENVIKSLLANGIQVNCIGNTFFQVDFYDQIVLNTGGLFFDIYGNFRDILLEISRLGQATNHFLTFNHPEPITASDEFAIEVHYAGLGGREIIHFESVKKTVKTVSGSSVNVYPNPFTSYSNIEISNPKNYTCKLELYNALGQLISSKHIYDESGFINLSLNELVDFNDVRSNQLYLLKATIIAPNGDIIENQTMKIKKF